MCCISLFSVPLTYCTMADILLKNDIQDDDDVKDNHEKKENAVAYFATKGAGLVHKYFRENITFFGRHGGFPAWIKQLNTLKLSASTTLTPHDLFLHLQPIRQIISYLDESFIATMAVDIKELSVTCIRGMCFVHLSIVYLYFHPFIDHTFFDLYRFS